MRVTNRQMINNAVEHMSDNLERINAYSERIYTDKQFQAASDDPVSASQCLNLRSTLKTSQAYKNTADGTNDWMMASDFNFQQMQDVGNRALNIIQRGLNDTLSGDERGAALATEMAELLNHALEIGNASHNGQYLFGGYKTATPPFSLTGPSTVQYDGDSSLMQRSLGPGQNVTLNVTGDVAFSNFFNSLIAARDSLNLNDTNTLRTNLSALQSAMNTIDENRTANGARMRQVQTAVDYLDKVDTEVNGLLSKKQDANMAEAISALRGQETAYQSVLEVSQRAISALNLFDYLR